MVEKKQLGPGFNWTPSKEILEHKDRFIDKLSISRIETCWTWKGKIENTGYAVFLFGGRVMPIHKYAWHLWRGDTQKGQFARPTACESKYCVSMYHMTLVGRGWTRLNKNLIRDRDLIISKWLYGKRSVRYLSKEYNVSWDTMNKFIANNQR